MSHGNAVLSAPVRCQFHNFTKAATDTIYHRDSHQSATVARSKNHEAFPNHQRDHQTAGRHRVSSRRRRVSPESFTREIWRQTSCSSAGPHRTTNWWRGATGGEEAVVRYRRASNHPDPNNATKLFLLFMEMTTLLGEIGLYFKGTGTQTSTSKCYLLIILVCHQKR